jgi:feruloyl esterase
MRGRTPLLALTLLVVRMSVAGAQTDRASACAALGQHRLPDTTIATAEAITTGTFSPPRGGEIGNLPPFCRVAGAIAPTKASEILFEVWLPLEKWNGKFSGVGNGGWAGVISYGALAEQLRRGYASASTNTGHDAVPGLNMARFAFDSPERLIDFAHRAHHETAGKGKALVQAFYGKAPERAYFVGCSSGGYEGLMEAQRYPADYDGVVAGAPANNWTRLMAGDFDGVLAVLKDPASHLSPSALSILHRAVLAACDGQDGVTDNVLEDPRQCKFDPASVQCADGQSADACLTPSQVAAARRIYGGAKDPKTGAHLYPGLAPGSEPYWPHRDPANPFPIPLSHYKWLVFADPDWDWRTFEWTDPADYQAFLDAEAKYAPILNATNPDLREFRKRGGKLIQWHGWNDQLISAQNSIDYYESVLAFERRRGTAPADVHGFYRLFMAPGMAHCSGGTGPNSFDMQAALEQWVERGIAPDRIVATRSINGVVERSRPLCVYPTIAVYKGKGDTNDVASFECREQQPAVVTASAPAPGQVAAALSPAVRAAADKITAERLARDLQYLASDELVGRNTPSPGYDAAAQYIARRLEKAGLQPLGGEGGFFQRYTMRESRLDTAAASLEFSGRRWPFGDGFVLRSFAGALSGTFAMVYVGHGWSVPSAGVDPYRGLDLKGKVVVAHGPRAFPKGVEIRQIGRVTIGAVSPLEEAQRRGAAAIVYLPPASAMDGWERMREQNTVRRELEPPVPSAYAAPGVTSVLLARQAAEALIAGERSPDLLERGDRQDYPASFELDTRLTVNLPASTLDHRPFNVVALLEGSDPVLRREYVTVEAHLDGAVGTRPVDGDAVYNSADDNASGSAAALSIAEQMAAAPRPRRSVLFIWDSGEERGLWGTRHFVGRPPVPLDSVVAHFNVDMIGADRRAGSADEGESRVTGPNEVYVIGPRVLSARADALLEAVNDAYLKLKLNRDHDRASSEFFYPRTDAGPFLERGILTIGFTTGIHDRYHLPSDEARYLDPKKMEAIARTVFVAVWAFADTPERPRIERPLPESVPRIMHDR